MEVIVLYTILVWVSILVIPPAGAYYAWRIWQRKVKAAPTAWILMVTMMVLACWMYHSDPHHQWSGNIALLTGAVNAFTIFAAVMARAIVDKNPFKQEFTWVQKACLIGGGVITFAWTLTNDHFTAYCLVQSLGVVSYTATALKVLREKQTTEPYEFWVAVLIANASAIYPALIRHDHFSYIYLGRSMTSGVILLFIIRYVRQRAPRANN